MATKSQQVRDILAANKGKKLDDLVEQVVKKTGLSNTLAKVYLSNNSQKAKTRPKAQAAKKVAAKTTSSEKAVAAAPAPAK